MDPVLRDTLFAGLADRDIVEAVVCEMRRRELYGCVFFMPMATGPSVFGSSSPAGTLSDLTASQQLAVFAEVASKSIGEKSTKIADDTDISFDPPKWMN